MSSVSFPTTTLRAPPKAFEGMLANGRADRVDSKVVGGTASIHAGRFVCFHAGDDDQAVRLPATTAEVENNNAMGVTILDVMRMSDDGTVGNPYAAGEPLPVLRDGEIWVNVEEAVTPASLVYVRITESSGGAADTGKFRASADSGKAVIAYGFKYMTSTTGAGLALLAVKLPQGNTTLPTGA
jgi:hypothetical protein